MYKLNQWYVFLPPELAVHIGAQRPVAPWATPPPQADLLAYVLPTHFTVPGGRLCLVFHQRKIDEYRFEVAALEETAWVTGMQGYKHRPTNDFETAMCHRLFIAVCVNDFNYFGSMGLLMPHNLEDVDAGAFVSLNAQPPHERRM